MKKFIKKIEDTMSAAAFAEAGEFETAREIHREIHKGQKTVLLAISDSLYDRNALKYALNVSQRTNAALEVLYVTHFERKSENLNNFLAEVKKEGFRFSLVIKTGCMKQAILNYTDKKSEILFVIVGSKFELDVECKGSERLLSDAWKRLKCPLVVVSKNEALLPA